jgi:hypothetical protein
MKLSHRRQILHLVVGAAALPATMGAARAQADPTRPIANRFRRPRWRNGQLKLTFHLDHSVGADHQPPLKNKTAGSRDQRGLQS